MDRESQSWVPSLTFRLLKLHGSLDWWMSPRDPTGATLVREALRFDVDGVPIGLLPEDRYRTLTGRELALVPPVLTKGAYFTNLVTRELWTNAAAALANADHVSIVGYSLPPGDSTMAGLLVSTLHREGVDITIVNRTPGDLAERVGHLTSAEVDEIGGDDSVMNFVASYIDRVDSDFRRDFQRPSPLTNDSLPLIVTTGSGDHMNLLYRVTRLERVGTELVLRTIPRGNVMATAVNNEGLKDIPPFPPTSQDLAGALEGVTRVIVDLDGTRDGICRPVRARFGFPVTIGNPISVVLLVVPEPNPARLT